MKKLDRRFLAILLAAWVFGILAPLFSLRRFSARYREVFDWIFHTHTSHVLMHTFLYAVLAFILCSLLSRPARSATRLIIPVLLGIAVVAGLQEAIQMLCEHLVPGADEIFDFFVDLNGGLLGILLFLRITHPAPLSTADPQNGRPQQ